jgi:hypothetical protein
MVSNAAAVAGGIITDLGSGSGNLIQSGAYDLGRAAIAQAMIAVADPRLIVGQSLNRKIFAELPEPKIVAGQLTFAVLVGIHLMDQNRSVLAAMLGEIALAVTVDIQPPN